MPGDGSSKTPGAIASNLVRFYAGIGEIEERGGDVSGGSVEAGEKVALVGLSICKNHIDVSSAGL